nr:uncharacterized protein LOC115259334 [Aedes albopictus]
MFPSAAFRPPISVIIQLIIRRRSRYVHLHPSLRPSCLFTLPMRSNLRRQQPATLAPRPAFLGGVVLQTILVSYTRIAPRLIRSSLIQLSILIHNCGQFLDQSICLNHEPRPTLCRQKAPAAISEFLTHPSAVPPL